MGRSLRPLVVALVLMIGTAASTAWSQAPPPVTGLRVTATDTTTAVLTWDLTPCSGEYVIYRSATPFNLQGAGALASVAAPPFVDTPPGDIEYYGVRCEDPFLPPGGFSNMGFWVARDLDTINGLPGMYLVDWPLFSGLGDVANTSFSGTNKCVGDPGPPTGPTAGDSMVNADDAICWLWTSRRGSVAIARFDASSCSFALRTATKGGLGGIRFNGTAFDLGRDEGFLVNLPFSGADGPTANRGVLAGAYDPTYSGTVISAPPGCRPKLRFINFPNHAFYQKADEILCGLEGVDFNRDPVTGDPDKCFDAGFGTPTGIFDGTTPITVSTFDNVPDSNGTDGLFLGRTVMMTDRGLAFLGPNFDLEPGHAYGVALNDGQAPTTFIPPHF